MPIQWLDIAQGLNQENNAVPTRIRFTVNHLNQERGYFVIQLSETGIKDDGGRQAVDPSFEGAKVWWPSIQEQLGGAGRILRVDTDTSKIIIQASTLPPSQGRNIYIYPHDFIETLHKVWENNVIGEEFLALQAEIAEPKRISEIKLEIPKNMRNKQGQAFDLINYRSAFIEGPPGTGKTTTLGYLLAALIKAKPKIKILLVSTTNVAIDETVTKADDALEEIGCESGRLARLGSSFSREKLKDHDHLIPVKDREILDELYAWEAHEPEDRNGVEHVAWDRERIRLQNKIRSCVKEAVLNNNLVAMTVYKATLDISDIKACNQFDYVVFDEASQISLAAALPLASLGKQLLFAGDPKQLAPIVMSQKAAAQNAFGQSPFDLVEGLMLIGNHGHIVQLDEQSRMAAPICNLVSQVFYSGRLRVASDSLYNGQWLNNRKIDIPILGESNVCVIDIQEEALYNYYRGNVRHESADKIVDILKLIKNHEHPRPLSVKVLTPFRSQRSLINSKLSAAKMNKKYEASTIHSIQGQSADIVIVDLVNAASNFFNGQMGKRLVNVAISRAEAKLFLLVSEGERQRDYVKKLCDLAKASQAMNNEQEYVDLIRHLNKGGSIYDLIGDLVSYERFNGELVSVHADEDVFVLFDFATGERKIKLSFLEAMVTLRNN